ncbi:MAG TPA: hypothetical protein VFO70_02615, partial [Chitinophagaceae bacterium]|nr:hypothetical protein [Chitinophagaceae bacterium]
MRKLSLVLMVLLLFTGISQSQNVGIGTTTPSSRLHIIGNELSVPLRIQNTLVSGYAGMHFHSSTGELTGHLGYANASASFFNNRFYVGTTVNVPFVLTSNNLERIRISGTGETGIGTSNP